MSDWNNQSVEQDTTIEMGKFLQWYGELSIQNRQMREQMQMLVKQIQGLAAENAKMKESFEKNKTANDELETARKAVTGNLEMMQNQAKQIERLKFDVKTLNGLLAEKDTIITGLKTELSNVRDRIAELTPKPEPSPPVKKTPSKKSKAKIKKK
jgi:predicted RNase H-like nuclease (RuvC/YqgF family)